MRVAPRGIRLLDEDEPTGDDLTGRLPVVFEEAGFVDVVERERLRTPFGLMTLVTALAA